MVSRPGHASGRELPVEVPDGEPVGGGIELVVHLRLFPRQRVEVGDEVAAHPVDPHERGDLHLLAEELLLPVDRADVAAPVDLLVGHAERPEHVVVEAVLADEALVDGLEEQARLGALDDAMVVRRRDRDDLADAELAEGALVGALPLGGVVDGADADDHALAGHEARHRLDRADRAGVGERDEQDATETRPGQANCDPQTAHDAKTGIAEYDLWGSSCCCSARPECSVSCRAPSMTCGA